MISRTLVSYISIAGVGATILTLFVLLAPTQVGTANDKIDIQQDQILDQGYRYKKPSCGDSYRKERHTHYCINKWQRDVIVYNGANIMIWHRVTYDQCRRQYKYQYNIYYDGNKNILMRWDVLDQMRSSANNSSCILNLDKCSPHKFTMWCDKAPVKQKGTIQLYNNRPCTDDWNYWQCNQTTASWGPVPVK